MVINDQTTKNPIKKNPNGQNHHMEDKRARPKKRPKEA